MSKILKVGDEVLWRGSWGMDNGKVATIVGIDKTKTTNSKEGVEVDVIEWGQPFVCNLDNGRWAYSTQVSPL